MTPLVDVVMVILIFLMLTGSFGGIEHYLQSHMPLSQKGGGPSDEKQTVPDTQVTITVDSPTPDRFVAQAGRLKVTDLDMLVDDLSKMRQTFNAGGTPTEKLQVIISPGKYVKYKFTTAVFEAALRAKFTKVGFSSSH